VRLGYLDHEVFGLILVDKRHRVIEYVELFRGTIDGALYLVMRPSIAHKCL
jgi:DNA repair protein RadC